MEAIVVANLGKVEDTTVYAQCENQNHGGQGEHPGILFQLTLRPLPIRHLAEFIKTLNGSITSLHVVRVAFSPLFKKNSYRIL